MKLFYLMYYLYTFSMYCKTNQKTKVLIDGSYLIYSTYFNTNFIYKKKFPNKPIKDNEDLSENKKFMEIFNKIFTKNFRKIKKFFNILYNDIFFVRDCLRETIWRLEIYDKYKMDRQSSVKHQNKDVDLGNLFMVIYNDTIEELRQKMKFNVIKVEEAEADDTICLLSKLMQKDGFEVNIISNDSDFKQLLNDNVNMYDIGMKKKNINDEGQNLLLYKILRGDRSDNIRGFKISKKNFTLSYILDLLKHPNGNNLYIRNRKLIDFNYIPLRLKREVLEYYNNNVIV